MFIEQTVTPNCYFLNDRKFITERIILKVCFVIPFQSEVISACKFSIARWLESIAWMFIMSTYPVRCQVLAFLCLYFTADETLFSTCIPLSPLYLLKVEATLIHLPMSKPNSCMSHHAGLWRCSEEKRIVSAILFKHLNFCLVLSIHLCFSSVVCLLDGCKTKQKLSWMGK